MRPLQLLAAAAASVTIIGLTTSIKADFTNAPTSKSTLAHADTTLRGELVNVLRNAKSDELIPISIVLKQQLDDQTRRDITRLQDKRARRTEMIRALQTVANNAQQDIVNILQQAQTRGQVSPRLRTLWIHNVIATDATPDVIRQLSQHADIDHINWDRPVGNEIFPVQPTDLEDDNAIVQQGGRALECGVDLMGAPDVWSTLGYDGDGVVVGTIDTGTCITHPDLAGHLWVNTDEIPGNGVDDDSNGYVDDINGWNFRDDTNDIDDDNSHGTHVAGTVCSDGSAGEQVGMAPAALLMTLRIWNNFAGESAVWEAMQYGVDNDCDIFSVSLGWPHGVGPDRPIWRAACENAIAGGVIVIYAAGNEGGGTPPDNVRTPGDVPDVITIGATDCSDVIAGFSSRGPVTWQSISPYFDHPYPPGLIKPDVSAPGVSTLSCSNDCSGYSVKSGTSMATPHAAGAAALMLQANPSLDHFDVKAILMDTSIDLGAPGMDNDFGAGRIDAFAATEAALDQTPSADLNSDGNIDTVDLLMLLAAWGDCDGACPPTYCLGDINHDCEVSTADLLVLLAQWTG